MLPNKSTDWTFGLLCSKLEDLSTSFSYLAGRVAGLPGIFFFLGGWAVAAATAAGGLGLVGAVDGCLAGLVGLDAAGEALGLCGFAAEFSAGFATNKNKTKITWYANWEANWIGEKGAYKGYVVVVISLAYNTLGCIG